MTQIAALERLSTELHVQIMLDLDSTGTLYELIRASPRLLQVFCANKSVILSRLARKGFHPRALIEAMSIAEIDELPRPLAHPTAIALLNTPLVEHTHGLLSNRSVRRSETICKLRTLIDFFVRDYANNTIPILNNLTKPIETHYPAGCTDCSISSSEYLRLQRAFCRFELFYRLFGECVPERHRCVGPNPYDIRQDSQTKSAAAREQAKLFLIRYEAAEIAEIHCIRDYLERRLRGFLDDVEDYAVQSPQSPCFKLRGWQLPGGGCPGIFSVDAPYEQGGHIEHLTSLGLSYIRDIMVAEDGDERTDLMLHGACGMSLPEDGDSSGLRRSQVPRGLQLAIAVNFDNPTIPLTTYAGYTDQWSQTVGDDDEDSLSPGWMWYCGDGRHGTHSYQEYDVCDKQLRDWGHVFWDHERLCHSGVWSVR